MKKVIVSLMAVACIALSASAQEIPERKREESKPILKEKIISKKERANLNLTDEQKVKLKSMKQDLRKQMEDLRKQESLTVKEYRDKMEILRKDREEKFHSILTDEQKTQLKKDKDAYKEKSKEFGKKRLAKMKEELKLTDDQVEKMKENRKVLSEKLETIRENKSLSEEQRKQEIKETMKKQKENMKSVLNEEQLQKMKENRKQHKRTKKEVI